MSEPKFYWAVSKDDEQWRGPFASVEEAKRDATEEIPFGPIWIAPVDADTDDDDRFWLRVADLFLGEYENVDMRLVEEGWVDPEEAWLTGLEEDRNGDLARALREVLGPRPEWRTVDTLKAERVEL